MRFFLFVFVSVCVSNVWPKTTLPVWPRDGKKLDTVLASRTFGAGNSEFTPCDMSEPWQGQAGQKHLPVRGGAVPAVIAAA